MRKEIVMVKQKVAPFPPGKHLAHMLREAGLSVRVLARCGCAYQETHYRHFAGQLGYWVCKFIQNWAEVPK
jgi:hypothetical protein